MPQFKDLPRELRCEIWNATLAGRKILPLAVGLEVAVAVLIDGPNRFEEYIVFSGEFRVDDCHLSVLKSVQHDVCSLSLTSVESRAAVVRKFPDLLTVRLTVEGGPQASKNACCWVRCNLATDIFLFNDVSRHCRLIKDNADFAVGLQSFSRLSESSLERAQIFRDTFKRIQNLAINASLVNLDIVGMIEAERSGPSSALSTLQSLLAGMTGVRQLYLWVGGPDPMSGLVEAKRLDPKYWERDETASFTGRVLGQIRSLYENNTVRFIAPCLHSIQLRDIAHVVGEFEQHNREVPEIRPQSLINEELEMKHACGPWKKTKMEPDKDRGRLALPSVWLLVAR